jgi:hypothetical protein
LRGVSKDGHERLRPILGGSPLKGGEHLGMTAECVQATLAFPRFWPQIRAGRLAVDEPLANRVRSGRKQP